MQNMAKVGGEKKQQLDSRTKRFHIFEGQTISVKQLKEKIELAHIILLMMRCKSGKKETPTWSQTGADLGFFVC